MHTILVDYYILLYTETALLKMSTAHRKCGVSIVVEDDTGL